MPISRVRRGRRSRNNYEVRHLNYLCFSNFKHSLPTHESPPPPHQMSPTPSTKLSSIVIDEHSNNIIDHHNTPSFSSTVSSSSPEPQEEEADYAAILASQRFFFSSPGASNSIIESSTTNNDNNYSFTSSSSSSSSPSHPSSSEEIMLKKKVLYGCVAVATYSVDPYVDFRRSMEEMVEASPAVIWRWEALQELLECYLALNTNKTTHKFIVAAFLDLVLAYPNLILS